MDLDGTGEEELALLLHVHELSVAKPANGAVGLAVAARVWNGRVWNGRLSAR